MSFTEESRYQYSLTPDSLVIDAGSYKGEWSLKIANRYNCYIWAFDPITSHFCQTRELLDPFKKVHCFNAALGGSTGIKSFSNRGDSSGEFTDGKMELGVECSIISMIGGRNIDLLKLNIEGTEYDLLECLIRHDDIFKVKNIQVQFHNTVPNWENRYKETVRHLAKTHTETWGAGPVWENWRLK